MNLIRLQILETGFLQLQNKFLPRRLQIDHSDIETEVARYTGRIIDQVNDGQKFFGPIVTNGTFDKLHEISPFCEGQNFMNRPKMRVANALHTRDAMRYVIATV